MKRMLYTLASIVPLAGIGCTQYVDAQRSLTDQARKGVALVAEAQASHEARSAHLHDMRRRQLDDAFDADVRERSSFDSEWIIEHRRAYSAALDLLHRARAEQSASDAVTRRNLDAIDTALQRLRWLQSLQTKWLDLSENAHEQD